VPDLFLLPPLRPLWPRAFPDIPTLPAGFPAHLSHKMAWTGADFNNKSDHIFVLSETHIAEIKAALEAYKGMSFHFGFV
jgi:hypothetical protein